MGKTSKSISSTDLKSSIKTLLVVLQNPYQKGQLKSWNPAVWRKEFESSRSGQRLLKFLPTRDWTIKYSNANPKIGASSDSKFDANTTHLSERIQKVSPTAILACGDSAREAVLSIWDGPLFCMPHPAYRVLTNLLVEGVCRNILDFGILKDNPDLMSNYANCNMWEMVLVSRSTPRLQYIQTYGDYKVVDLVSKKEFGDVGTKSKPRKSKQDALITEGSTEQRDSDSSCGASSD